MKPPVQTELALENPDSRTETVGVDEFQAAAERLRLAGFQIVALVPIIGKGRYVLHATRIIQPGPDLDGRQSTQESKCN